MAMGDIKESDWKLFKTLRELALERFCTHVLDEVASIGSDETKSKHERYGAIYRLMRERDKEIDPIFDYLRRSSAFMQICNFRSRGLMTEEELHRFSPELAGAVESVLQRHEMLSALEVEELPAAESDD